MYHNVMISRILLLLFLQLYNINNEACRTNDI